MFLPAEWIRTYTEGNNDSMIPSKHRCVHIPRYCIFFVSFLPAENFYQVFLLQLGTLFCSWKLAQYGSSCHKSSQRPLPVPTFCAIIVYWVCILSTSRYQNVLAETRSLRIRFIVLISFPVGEVRILSAGRNSLHPAVCRYVLFLLYYFMPLYFFGWGTYLFCRQNPSHGLVSFPVKKETTMAEWISCNTDTCTYPDILYPFCHGLVSFLL